jgi:Bacteriophage protein gp37
MGEKSSIEWTEATWNPLTGCNRVSPGCKNCYAERMSVRLKAMGQPNYSNGFKLALHEESLAIPFRWKKPMNIFVNSMSDLFYEEVPIDFIESVFDVMNKAHWHRFQVLTKRSERLLDLSPQLHWASNIWMGVSVENKDYIYRIDQLRETHASIKFLSIEPMLGPLDDINLNGIDWVIVGGESGPGARPMNSSWVISVRDQCLNAGVPFFFKQWGGVNKKKAGRQLDGRTWNEMPSREKLGNG